MASRNNQENKTGRTFWDYCHENPKKVIMLVLGLFLLATVLSFKEYTIKSPYISVVPDKKVDSTTDKRVENDKQTKKTLSTNEKPKAESKFDIKDNTFKGPAQIGDNNVQNIGINPRDVNDSLLNVIMPHIPSINQRIVIDRQDQATETNNLAKSLMNALKAKGYNNVSISLGVVIGGGTVWLDDPERTMREQRWFRITKKEDNEIHIQIPEL